MANIERIKGDIIGFLVDKFPEANIETEFGAPGKFVVHIIWDDFGKMSEETRQDEVWELLHGEFKYIDLKHIGFIMTWTPEELAFYEQEYGNPIAETTSSK